MSTPPYYYKRKGSLELRAAIRDMGELIYEVTLSPLSDGTVVTTIQEMFGDRERYEFQHSSIPVAKRFVTRHLCY